MKTIHLHSVITAIAFLAVLLLPTACDRNAHEGELILPEGHGGVVVGLQTEGGVELPTDDIHLFLFDADDRLAEYRYYDEPEKMALDVIRLPAGSYTVVAVLNTGADFTPPSSTRADLPSITLADFADWLNTVAGDYPDMLTGIAKVETETGDIGQVVITLKVGTEGVRLPVLRLLLTLPGEETPEYKPETKSRAAGADYSLRCVAELYIKGSDKLAFHRPLSVALQTDGTCLVELQAPAGDYDLYLWTDYARADAPQADTYYHTESLKAITINTEPGYTANTDAKDAAYFTQTGISLTETGAEIEAELQRPLAKYRLIATDVEEYRKLREKDIAKFPPLEELTVMISYNGYFPSGFNATSGKPNSAVGGITYSSALPSVPQDEKEVQIGSDWVFVNGTESLVNVAIQVLNKQGEVISRIENTAIAYRRNYNTTIKGGFLTAGQSGGNIQVNTEWDGSYDVEF